MRPSAHHTVLNARARRARRRLVLSFALLAFGVTAVWALTPGPNGPRALATAGVLSQESSSDSVVLKDGTTLTGTLLDETEEQVVIETAEGKAFHPRGDVEKIERSASSQLLAFFEKYEAKASTEKHWRNLADFTKKRDLLPEHRKCLRRLLELNPDDLDARLGLGEALLDGEWLTESEVEAKLKEGYERDGNSLKKTTKATTVVDKKDQTDTVAEHIKIIPRKKLSPRDQKRMDDARERAHANADRFRKKLAREREGVEWVDRFKVRTQPGNFEIHSNTTLELTRKYGLLMELIRDKLARMFRSPVYRKLRAPVFIHRTQEDFMESDLYGRWGGRGLGGYYMPTNQSIHTYHGTFGFTGTTYSVLAHEGTHYFQGLVLKGGFDNIPIWLIEGLAVYFGDGSKFDSEKKRIDVGLVPRDRLSHIQEKMLRKRHTSIDKLVGMTRYTGFSGSHYADAWALIYFLVKSSSKGENLMKEYWSRGLEEKLTKKDFIELAEKYYGSVEELQKQYVDFILKVRPPRAGEVKGEYFDCDAFQFEFRAPTPEWQFFEDQEDKKLVVGLLLPGSSAQIRIYYENNIENKKASDYFEEYLRRASFYENLKHEKVKIGGLDGYKLTYVDTGRGSLASMDIEIDDDGEVVVLGGDEGKKRGPRDVIKFMLIQVDGVCSIECASKKGELDKFFDVFDKANDLFAITLTRRW